MTTPTCDAARCALLLNCSVAHVLRLARARELPGVKVGRAWVFVEADLIEWLQHRRRLDAPLVRKPGRPRRRLAASPHF